MKYVLIEFGFSSPSFSSTSSPSFIMTKQKIQQKKKLKEKAKIVRENSRFFSSSINNTIFL